MGRHVWTPFLPGILAFLGSIAARAEELDHRDLDQVLRSHVRDGRVDYGRLTGEREALDRYLAAIAGFNPDQLPGEASRKAFWINAYNALVLKSVLDHYPVSAVTRIDGFFDRTSHPVGGETLSIEFILNEKVRRSFRDPRMLFLLSPGSASGPAIPGTAVTAATLDDALDQAARRYLATAAGVEIDDAQRQILLSPLFRWYREDFDPPGLRRFLLEFGPVVLINHLSGEDPHAIVARETYDWTLNDTSLTGRRPWAWPWRR